MYETMTKPRHKAPSGAKRRRSASGADEVDRSDKGRWSNRRRTEIVLRLFRGETLDALRRELGGTPGKLTEWRDQALAGVQAGRQSREPDHHEGFIRNLKAQVVG
jgi:transposase